MFNKQLYEILETTKLISGMISNKRNKDAEWNKVCIRLIKISEEIKYQFEYFTDTKVYHKNVNVKDLVVEVNELLTQHFKQAELYAEDNDYFLKVTKKNQLLMTRKKASKQLVEFEHNKQKQYLLSENIVIPALVDLGVMTKEGKIVNSKYDKFKQINRFVEFIDDIIDIFPKEETINIVDFGCGKSYLTFIVYYFLVYIKKMKVNIIGLDLKADVIKHCNDMAKKYNYDNLKFEVGNIEKYETKMQVHMVISLHACDTATDAALAQAVKWNAKAILSVPCCQHEINNQIKNEILQPILKYGIIKERMSALITDAVRANVLEQQGYKVQILEFVDIQHSPKNLLIRAVKAECKQVKTKENKNNYKNLTQFLNISPSLERFLK